jgi:hypothetical protein
MHAHAHTHPYEYTNVNPTLVSIFEDWGSHHKRLAVDENVAYHWKHNAIKS